MSVVAAIVTPRFALMGSDSQLTPGKGLKNAVKIYAMNDGGLLGLAGSWGLIRKLVMEWNGRGSFDAIPKSAWPSDAIIDALYISPDHHVFSIDGAWSIAEMKSWGYYGAGSGGDVAVGCLWKSMQGLDLTSLRESRARELLREAIAAACQMDDYCGGRIRIKKL